MPKDIDTLAAREARFSVLTRQVWVAVWKIVLPGAVLGIVFLIAGEIIPNLPHVISALLKEIGTGFIVACIAVFGYEYLRHVSGVVEAQAEFRDQISLLKEISERASHDALREDLRRVLMNHKKLSDAVVETVQPAVDMCDRSRADVLDPASSGANILQCGSCLNLLAEVAHDSLLSIANTVNSFHDDVLKRYISPGGHEYRLPDSREIAGKVLSLLLSSLERGDYYKSVANVFFYQNTLMGKFEKAAEAACGRGIVIQRVFNLTNLESGPLSEERFRECRAIIRAHLLLQKKIEEKHRGGYQIRFYGSALSPFVHECFNPADCPHLSALPRSYFGLFCQKSRNANLLFFACDPNRASRVLLALRDQNDPTESYFDRMWRVAEAAPNPLEGEAFKKNWLDTTVANLVKNAAGHDGVPAS